MKRFQTLLTTLNGHFKINSKFMCQVPNDIIGYAQLMSTYVPAWLTYPFLSVQDDRYHDKHLSELLKANITIVLSCYIFWQILRYNKCGGTISLLWLAASRLKHDVCIKISMYGRLECDVFNSNWDICVFSLGYLLRQRT